MSILQAAKNLRSGLYQFFTTDVATRSPENPATPITSEQLAGIFDGTPAKSGVAVTERTALRSTVVLACVRLIAEAIASLPLHVYERTADGGRQKARSHSLYSVLHDRPNEFMTSFTWRELALAHVLMWGNHYSEIQWTGGGDIAALWPLPVRTKAFVSGGRLRYLVPMPDGTTAVLPAERVLHVPGLGFDGISGNSVIQWGKEAIALSIAGEEYGARFFSNNANPGGVIESEKKLDEDARKRLKTAWEASHGGLDRAHRVAVLEEGLKWKQTGISPEDAQALEMRKFQVAEITRLFRVPPHLVSDVDRSTSWGTGIEQQNIGLVMYTLRPWLVRFEQAFNYRLFLPSDRPRYFAEHSVDGLLRGDAKSRNEALAIQRQNGIISTNEWRALENLNPLPEPAGELYLVPMNMVPADQLRNDAESQEPDAGDVVGEQEKIQDTALNGAQVQALVGILAEVVAGRITKQTAKALILVAFPRIPTSSIDAMLADVDEGSDPDAAVRSHLRTANNRERRSNHLDARKRLAESFRPVLADAMKRVARRERNDVLAAAKNLLDRRDAQQLKTWITEFFRDHVGFVQRQAEPVYRSIHAAIVGSVGEQLDRELGGSAELESFLDDYVGAFSSRHAGISKAETLDALNRALESGTDPLEALQEHFQDYEENRVAEDVDWEITRSENAFAKAAYAAAGVMRLIWRTRGDSCDYCMGLDGTTVGVNESFLRADEDYQPTPESQPLRPTVDVGHPPAHRGCDCGIEHAL